MMVEGSGETSDRCVETSVPVEFDCMSVLTKKETKFRTGEGNYREDLRVWIRRDLFSL